MVNNIAYVLCVLRVTQGSFKFHNPFYFAIISLPVSLSSLPCLSNQIELEAALACFDVKVTSLIQSSLEVVPRNLHKVCLFKDDRVLQAPCFLFLLQQFFPLRPPTIAHSSPLFFLSPFHHSISSGSADQASVREGDEPPRRAPSGISYGLRRRPQRR